MYADSPQGRVLRAIKGGAEVVADIAKSAELGEQQTRTALLRLRDKGLVKPRRVRRTVEVSRVIYEPVELQ